MRVMTLLLAALMTAGAPSVSFAAAEANQGQTPRAYSGGRQASPPPAKTARERSTCRKICPITGQCLDW